jgi:hypothetical protein
MRIRTVVVATVLVVALVTFVVVNAVSSSASPTSDHLRLDGRTPSTVQLAVSLHTGGSLSLSGTISIDAENNSLSAQLLVPVLTADTAFELRALNDRLYLTSPNLANASGPVWYVVNLKWPSLSGLAHYLVRPNAAVLSLLANASTSHHGDFTTYEITRRGVGLGTLGSQRSSSTISGNLEVRVTTGGQGEFTGLWASFTSHSATTEVSFRVVSYDHRLRITAPPASRATTSALPLLRELLSSGALGSVVLPSALLHFFSTAKVS